MRDNFLRDAKVPISDSSYDVQIWLLFFAPCLTHLFVPPCRDPSTRPHNQESIKSYFYGCETWSLTLRKERRLRVFENMVLRSIFGPRRDEVTGEWRRLLNEELNDL